MTKFFVRSIVFLSLLVFTGMQLFAQQSKDTASFFLAKKKGVLGRIGRSISHDGKIVEPIKIVDRFIQYKGKTIRKIVLAPVGFNQDLNDTTEIKNTYSVHVANALHKNSTNNLIRRNLFFKEGDKVLPLLFSDNEHFLRDQPFLRDALIVVFNAVDSKDSVDVVVLTRDVFSLGGSGSLNSISRAKVEAKEENLNGTGNRLAIALLFDQKRTPKFGVGSEYINRNIKGSFISWTTGFTSFNNEIISGLHEEKRYYTSLEKPLVSRYSEWTASLGISYNSTDNAYNDSLYHSDFKYSYSNIDIWGGYNIGARNRKERDSEKRLRHFVAMRSFYNHFYSIPVKYIDNYNYNYADINGVLFSYSLYKQNFYQSNFIYGFGRNEDVPQGINATVTGGYTNKQGVERGYYGFDFDATHYSERGNFTSYTLRVGTFVNKKIFEDVDVLADISHFTGLKKIGSSWRNRNFLSASVTRQVKTKLNQPLFLESNFGLPYFRNGPVTASTRSTIKFESVFYNLRKIAGFRIAPFIFTDVSFLKPINAPVKKTNGFTALGGGIRTRNENLIFGTIELRGYYFPRVSVYGMRNWKIQVTTNLKFKYNSSFIRRPDFVITN
ncbi:MAG: hypothetical protein ABJA37_08565 [Ferruginibacter sp.]